MLFRSVIEAALIVAILFGGGSDNAAVARDTIFSAVMIVLNGVIGLCLVLGGNRHFEQRFQLQGAAVVPQGLPVTAQAIQKNAPVGVHGGEIVASGTPILRAWPVWAPQT